MTFEQIKETASFIQKETNNFTPTHGIVLGTGLGNLVEKIKIDYTLDYATIPHFPTSTVEQHAGKLIFGTLGEKKIVAMQGRFHFYEGYNMKQVTFPIRVMKLLGVQQLFISNISGSVNENLNEGDLLFINDHLYLHYQNPLTGANLDEFGPRWPDMVDIYSENLIKKAKNIAEKHSFSYKTGVYASLPGPQLETKAEYRMLNILGADAVGMSTVPEVIVGVHCGMEIFAVSVITDKNWPYEKITKVDIQKIISIAQSTEPKLTQLMEELIGVS